MGNRSIPTGRMSFAKQTEDEVESPGAKSEKSEKSEDDSQLRIAPFHHLSAPFPVLLAEFP